MKSSQGGYKLLASALALQASFLGSSVFAQSSTAAGTSTTSATAPANKLSLTMANQTNNSVFDTRTKGGASTLNVVSVGYRVTDDWKLAATARQDYKFVGTGEDQSKESAKYRDFLLSGSTTYGSFLGTEKTPVKYIVGLPTSQRSMDAKQAFSLGAEIILEHELVGNLGSAVKFVPVWGLRNGSADMLTAQTYGELRYTFTSKLSSYSYLEHLIQAQNDDSPSVKKLEQAEVGLGVSYSPNKVVDLDLAMARTRHLLNSAANNPSEKFVFLDEKELSFVAGATLKF